MGIIEELEELERRREDEIVEPQRRKLIGERDERVKELLEVLRNPDPKLDDPVIMDIKIKIPDEEGFDKRELPETPEIIRRRFFDEIVCGETIDDIIITTQRSILLQELGWEWVKGAKYITAKEKRNSNEPKTDSESREVEIVREKIEKIKSSTSNVLNYEGSMRFQVPGSDEFHFLNVILREALLVEPNMNPRDLFGGVPLLNIERIEERKRQKGITLDSIGNAIKKWFGRGER